MKGKPWGERYLMPSIRNAISRHRQVFFLRMGYLQLLQLFFLVLGVTQGNNFISSIVPIAGHCSGLDPVSLQWQTANLPGPQQVGQGYAVGACGTLLGT